MLGRGWIRLLPLMALLGPGCNCQNQKLAGVPGLNVSPNPLAFNAVQIGATKTLPLSLTNGGGGTLNILSATIVGDPDFVAAAPSSAALLAGASTQLQVSFTPTTAGAHTATLTLVTDSVITPTSDVQLLGTGVQLSVGLSSSALNFGCVELGAHSAAQTLTITNVSQSSETISVGPLTAAAGFAISPASLNTTLAPSGTAQLSVTFSPTVLGAAAATISISPCSGCTAVDVTLSGIGSQTELAATPSPVNFGYVPANQLDWVPVTVSTKSLPAGSNCAQPVTLTGVPTMQTDGGVFSIAISGGVDGGWPASLSAPETTSFIAQFESAHAGTSALDNVVIPYSVAGAAHAPLLVPLSAGVTAGPCGELSVTPFSVSFGIVRATSAPVSVSVVVANNGTNECDLTSIAIGTNDSANEFSLAPSTPAHLTFAPGQSSTLFVLFTPFSTAAPLARLGTMVLDTSDPARSQIVVPLSALVSTVVTGWVNRTAGTAASGHDWRTIASDASGQHLFAGAIVSNPIGGDLWTSSDYGATWIDQTVGTPAANLTWRSLVSSASGKYVVGMTAYNGVWTSDNYGMSGSWVSRGYTDPATGNTPAICGWYVASSANGQNLLGVSYTGAGTSGGDLWRSTDYGATWTDVTSTGPTHTQDWWVTASDSTGNKLVAVAYGGDIWTSVNGGAAWTNRSTGTAASGLQWWAVVSDTSGNKLVAAANNGDIWRSNDSGATWTDSGNLGAWVFLGSDAAGQHLIAGTDTSAQDIWLSGDYGLTWYNSTAGTSASGQALQTVAVNAAGNQFVAAGNSGDIWTYNQ